MVHVVLNYYSLIINFVVYHVLERREKGTEKVKERESSLMTKLSSSIIYILMWMDLFLKKKFNESDFKL